MPLEFKNVKRSTYILKISYVGYIPQDIAIEPTDSDVLDVGNINMKILNQDLFEVVIKTARAPLSIRGDTVEYNALVVQSYPPAPRWRTCCANYPECKSSAMALFGRRAKWWSA